MIDGFYSSDKRPKRKLGQEGSGENYRGIGQQGSGGLFRGMGETLEQNDAEIAAETQADLQKIAERMSQRVATMTNDEAFEYVRQFNQRQRFLDRQSEQPRFREIGQERKSDQSFRGIGDIRRTSANYQRIGTEPFKPSGITISKDAEKAGNETPPSSSVGVWSRYYWFGGREFGPIGEIEGKYFGINLRTGQLAGTNGFADDVSNTDEVEWRYVANKNEETDEYTLSSRTCGDIVFRIT